MAKKYHRLLDQSCSWINNHPRASNLDVPDEFVARWIYEDAEDEVRPSGFYLSVFAFGYMQTELIASGSPANSQLSVPVSRLIELFHRWQMKLGLAELHRRTDLQFKPLSLFEFPEGEQVTYWPK
jgi:hypothetical protein